MIEIKNEEQMINFGKKFAKKLPQKIVIFLIGDLGAGKTTFTRGILRGFDYNEKVKSPTFTVVEEYKIKENNIYHFDLYRMSDPEELELIGLRDYLLENSICIFEWPEKGKGVLPESDITIDFETKISSRLLKFTANTKIGENMLQNLSDETYI